MRVEIPGPRADSTIAAALFDFDETIIDLEAEHVAASVALCRERGADFEQLPDSIRRASGTRIIDELRLMREHFGWPESGEKLLVRRQQLFDEICRTAALEPMPGVREVVESLHARGIPLAITTSAVRGAIEIVLDRIALRDAFTLIVDGGDVQRGKPDPECFLFTARKLGVPPERCIVFEDSAVGVLAAKRAGMFCIAVRNPAAQTRQDLSAADVVADSFRSFLR